MDQSVACSQRGSNLRASQCEGKVKGRNSRDHTQRLAPSENPYVVFVGSAISAIHCTHAQTAKEAEQTRTMRHNGSSKIVVGHENVNGFKHGKIISALIHQIGDAKEQFCPFF